MPRTTHRMRASCPFANSDDGIEVEITFTYLPGHPATGPSYASGGDPATPDEVEFVSVRPMGDAMLLTLSTRLQKDLAEWADLYLADDEGFDAAVVQAMNDEDAARERAAELRRE